MTEYEQNARTAPDAGAAAAAHRKEAEAPAITYQQQTADPDAAPAEAAATPAAAALRAEIAALRAKIAALQEQAGPDAGAPAAALLWLDNDTPNAAALRAYDKEIAAKSIQFPYTFTEILERHALQDAAEAQGLQVVYEQPLPETIPAEALQNILEAGKPCPYYAALNLHPAAVCPKQDPAGGCEFLPPDAACPRYKPEVKELNTAVVLVAKGFKMLYEAIDDPEGEYKHRAADGSYYYQYSANVAKSGGPKIPVNFEITNCRRPLKPLDLAIMQTVFAAMDTDAGPLPLNDDIILNGLQHLPEEIRPKRIPHSPTQREKVWDAMKLLNEAQVTIKPQEQAEKQNYPGLSKEFYGSLLSNTGRLGYDAAGRQIGCYHIGKISPFLDYAQQIKQLSRVNFSCLSRKYEKSHGSDEKGSIMKFLLIQIESARRMHLETITLNLDRLFRQTLEINTIKGEAARQARQKLESELNDRCAAGYLAKWEWIKDKRTYIAVKITLPTKA